jgi:alkylation response protein AidB-like acyl-CoA dehydrogenase
MQIKLGARSHHFSPCFFRLRIPLPGIASCIQDNGEPFDVVSSELKIFTVPTIQEVTRMALQIHGAYGYSKEYKIERLYRNAAHGGGVASSTEINKTIAGMALVRG